MDALENIHPCRFNFYLTPFDLDLPLFISSLSSLLYCFYSLSVHFTWATPPPHDRNSRQAFLLRQGLRGLENRVPTPSSPLYVYDERYSCIVDDVQHAGSKISGLYFFCIQLSKPWTFASHSIDRFNMRIDIAVSKALIQIQNSYHPPNTFLLHTLQNTINVKV